MKWKTVEGLRIPSRQETRTEGEKTSHLLTVKSVEVNPAIDDSRFETPLIAKIADKGQR